MDGIAVVGTARGHGGDAAFCLPEQAWRLGRIVRVPFSENVGDDLAGVGVDGKVKLAPLPPGAAVLLGIPLALSKRLQAGAVQHEVHGPLCRAASC